MNTIKTALVGIGNCASALVQGIHFYQNTSENTRNGIVHWDIGGYMPGDIEIVAAIDVDGRKVGQDLSKAIYAKPNCSYEIVKAVPEKGGRPGAAAG